MFIKHSLNHFYNCFSRVLLIEYNGLTHANKFQGSYEEGYYECEYMYYDYQAWRADNLQNIMASLSVKEEPVPNKKKSKNANKNAKLKDSQEQVAQLEFELKILKETNEEKDLQIQSLQIELQEEKNKVSSLKQELANKEREWEQKIEHMEPVNRFIGYW